MWYVHMYIVQYAWHIFSNIWSSNVNSVFFFHITFPPKSHLFEIISSDQEARISVICHIFFSLENLVCYSNKNWIFALWEIGKWKAYKNSPELWHLRQEIQDDYECRLYYSSRCWQRSWQLIKTVVDTEEMRQGDMSTIRKSL